MVTSTPRHLTRGLAASALAVMSLAAGAATAAQASVAFPTPGVMDIKGLPAQLRAGEMFNLRELMPLAVWGGVVDLQRETSLDSWQTVSSGAVRPRVVWLHWRVPARLAGSQLSVRFVLKSGTQVLALSPIYQLGIAAPTLGASS